MCAEFQGPPDEAKCEAYQAMLTNEGKDHLVDSVSCGALWFDKGAFSLYLISIYYVVVTLTTYALQPCPLYSILRHGPSVCLRLWCTARASRPLPWFQQTTLMPLFPVSSSASLRTVFSVDLYASPSM
jgi:hypothetical protein